MKKRRHPKHTAVLLALLLAAARPSLASNLEAGFDNPTGDAKPLVWWHWINGNVTKEGIRADLEDMKRVGLGGAQILDVEIYLPAGPVRYGSDSWHEHIQYALQTAARLGLEIDIANSPGWSGSGGPWVTPERGMKKVVWSETTVAGGAVAVDLPRPTTKLDYYRDIAVIAVPPTTERLDKLPGKIGEAPRPVVRPARADLLGIPLDKVIDLTGRMDAQGRLTASLPPGEWTVLRFGYTPTGTKNHPAQPEGHGLEVDKLDVEAVTFHFEQSLGRIIREAGPLAGATLKGVLFDSFEAGFQNWTAAFPAEFSRRKGYDFVSYLPLIAGRVIGSHEESEAVLWDFRAVIEDLFTENYFGTLHTLAARHGLKIYSESQGGPLNPLANNRHVDVPMNEFWMPDAASRASRIKLSSSAAALFGRDVVGAEAFTATPENGKYLAIPSTLKSPGDLAFTLGINRLVFHHYTHQPVTGAAPGFSLGRYGTHFGRLNTGWPYADAWIDYLSRSQFLLQQGRAFADICLLVDEDMGYGLPSKTTKIAPGYDFIACPPAELREMSVRAGRVTHPRGPSFSLIVLPEAWVAELPTLLHLRKLARDGASILGDAPSAPAGLADAKARADFDALVAELWGGLDGQARKSKPFGAGAVYRGLKPAAVLEGAGIPADVSWTTPGADFKYIHRVAPEADVYFIHNYTGSTVLGDLRFRQQGRLPEIWDAATGRRSDAPIFSATADGLVVPIQFEPRGSAFVVFRKPLPGRWVASAAGADLEFKTGELLTAAPSVSLTYSDGTTRTVPTPAPPAPLAIAGPWQVSFTEGRGAPASASFGKLVSWSEHADPGIRYYSGTAIYRTTLTVSAATAGRRAIIDLGDVADLAKVVVNGHSAGVLWKPPFRADITSLLRDGANTLDVHVVNRWVNRLIGDEAIPVDYAYQAPGKSKFTDGRLLTLPDWLYDPARLAARRRHSFAVWKHFEADSPLLPSGLLGPVSLEWRTIVMP